MIYRLVTLIPLVLGRVTAADVAPDVSVDVAVNGDGRAAVAWREEGSGFDRIRLSTYDASGAGMADRVVVDRPYETESGPAVAMAPDGSVVVVYHDRWQQFDTQIYAARYAPDGRFLGRCAVSGPWDLKQQEDVAILSSGGFVVVWTGDYQDGDSRGVFGQRYNSSGSAAGSEFQVNTYTTDYQGMTSVSHDSSGGFVVVWTSAYQDLDGLGVFAQRFDSSGSAVGSEFQVNTYTTGDQWSERTSVSHDPSDGFVVIWTDGVPDGEG